MDYDICIIGAGVIGTALARELSQYEMRIALIEKNSDVADEVSKANSGIVHGGFDDKPGSVKSQFCIPGNRLFAQLHAELGIGYRALPSLVLAFNQDQHHNITNLYHNGIKNGLTHLKIATAAEIKEQEPLVNPAIHSALYCPDSGLVSPYEYGIALAENAISNGVKLLLEHRVSNIITEKNQFLIEAHTPQNTTTIRTRIIVNAAGLYADEIAAYVGITDYTISPRKGQYVIFETNSAANLNHVLFPAPSKMGKGILVTPTYHGNLLIGPSAEDHTNKHDVSTHSDELEIIIKKGLKSLAHPPHANIIRSYAGNRPIASTGDFIIRHTHITGFFELAGIASPGLTSSYAIAQHMRNLILNTFPYEKKDQWHATRKMLIPCNLEKQWLSQIERNDAVKLPLGNKNRIVCRCEEIRESTIRHALQSGIPLYNTDAIKRRTRAGMGHCQGRFCQPRVKEVLADEYTIPIESITKHGNTTEPIRHDKDIAARMKRIREQNL